VVEEGQEGRGQGKLLFELLLLLVEEGEVRDVMQFLTIAGSNPWKLAAPVTSMMVLSLGKLGLRSRWMMEVRDLRAAALISMRWSPFISSSSTSSSSSPEYNRPCTLGGADFSKKFKFRKAVWGF
jgi:hypothetical protein